MSWVAKHGVKKLRKKLQKMGLVEDVQTDDFAGILSISVRFFGDSEYKHFSDYWTEEINQMPKLSLVKEFFADEVSRLIGLDVIYRLAEWDSKHKPDVDLDYIDFDQENGSVTITSGLYSDMQGQVAINGVKVQDVRNPSMILEAVKERIIERSKKHGSQVKESINKAFKDMESVIGFDNLEYDHWDDSVKVRANFGSKTVSAVLAGDEVILDFDMSEQEMSDWLINKVKGALVAAVEAEVAVVEAKRDKLNKQVEAMTEFIAKLK